MSKQPFSRFGYPTDKPCCVCGCRPARIEPRFGYPACGDCYTIPPIEINHVRTDQNDKTMNDEYGDGSGNMHKVCPDCGLCIPCGDCDEYGCGAIDKDYEDEDYE